MSPESWRDAHRQRANAGIDQPCGFGMVRSAALSGRMANEVIQQQFVYPRRNLVCRIVPDAGEGGETIISLDELAGTLGGHPADCIVGTRPR